MNPSSSVSYSNWSSMPFPSSSRSRSSSTPSLSSSGSRSSSTPSSSVSGSSTSTIPSSSASWSWPLPSVNRTKYSPVHSKIRYIPYFFLQKSRYHKVNSFSFRTEFQRGGEGGLKILLVKTNVPEERKQQKLRRAER